LDHVRRTLLTAQLWRAAAIGEREPAKALLLLEDAEACPADLRDFAWRLYHRRCDRQRGILVGNKGEVIVCLAFSPAGTVLASGNHDGTVKLWDLAGHKLIRTLQGHKESVASVTFNVDGSVLASGSADGTVRLWDSAGNGLSVLEGHKVVNAVTFSPDGKTLAVGDQATVRLWEVATGRLRSQLTCKGQTVRVNSVAFTPDGASLLAWNGSDCITFWDLATGQQSGSIPQKTMMSISAMALSPDGKTVVVFDGEVTPKLWDVATRTARQNLEQSDPPFDSRPAFTPDSQNVVGWLGESVTFLDVTSGQTRFVLDTGGAINCLALAPYGAVCATGHGNTVKLWDVSPNPWQTAPKPFSQHRFSLLSRNGRYFVCYEKDGSVSLRLVETGERLNRIAAGKGHPVLISPDGQRIAQWEHHFKPNGMGKLDKNTEVNLWDAVRGQETARFWLPLSYWPTIEFNPDGRTLAIGESSGTLRLLDATDGALKNLSRNEFQVCRKLTSVCRVPFTE
jgi:WD40 repeat protein